MHSWFYILLASAIVSTFTHCAESHPTQECNQLTYELVMRRITEVTYHTHATVKDAYTKTKQYVDNYKREIDADLAQINAKLSEMNVRLVAIQSQLSALTTGPIVHSPTNVLEKSALAGGGQVASSDVDGKSK